eukprot:PITA_22304
MSNELPTIFEVVTGAAKKQSKEKTTVTNNSSSKNKSGIRARKPTCRAKLSKLPPPKGEDNTLDEDTLCGACGENYASDEFWIPPPKGEDNTLDEDTLCGACGENYASDEFWICCDTCKRWFHGKCLKITPAIAEHIKHYKCPSCSNKRPRI